VVSCCQYFRNCPTTTPKISSAPIVFGDAKAVCERIAAELKAA